MERIRHFSWGKKFIFGCMAIVLFLILIEFISFLIVKLFPKPFDHVTALLNKPTSTQFHPFLGWKATPNLVVALVAPCDPVTGKAVLKDSKQTFIKTNQEGLAEIPINYKKPDITIVITGGSTLFGHGSDNNLHTVPTFLAKIIHEQLGIKARIIDLAQIGYVSFQEMNMLNDWYTHGEKADLVLAISGTNDSMSGYREPNLQYVLANQQLWDGPVKLVRTYENSISHDKPFMIRINWKLLTQQSYFIKAFFSFKNMYQYRNAVDQLPVLGSPFSLSTEEINNRVNIAINQYAMMDAITKQHDGKFLMILQPNYFSKIPQTKQEDYCAITALTQYYGVSPEVKTYQQQFYSIFRNTKKPFQFIDMSNALNTKSITYVDHLHYSNNGAELFAHAIFEKIKPTLTAIQKNNKKRMG